MNGLSITLSHVEDSIIRILQKTMGMDDEALRSGASLVSIDGSFDSLAITELMISLEEEFDVEFDQSMINAKDRMSANLSELAGLVHDALMSSTVKVPGKSSI